MRQHFLRRTTTIGAAGFALLACSSIGARVARAQATKVVMLGTGTPNADPEHSGPGVAIVVNGASYIVDAGPGIVRRAAAAARQDSLTALAPANLERVFITHLHSDHTTGLPDLILTPWVLGRSKPLEVYGPPRTKRMVDLLEQAYADDIELRLTGGEPSNKTGYAAHAHDVPPGVVYRDSNVTVTAFAVTHGAWEHAYGYIFQTRDRKIVISGDTSPTDAIVAACNGCDVLVHEVYSTEKFQSRSPEWQAYHARYHTSSVKLGELAQRAKPKLLVLYHQLYWSADDGSLVREVKTHFTGVVLSGRDLAVY
jgi:ribonuclease BN (tRNA processing enzyme)